MAASFLPSRFMKRSKHHYAHLHRQALQRVQHPLFPWVLLLCLCLWVGASLSQIWLRVQPVLTAHAISKEVYEYQALMEKKKKLVLELSQKRAEWYTKAQTQFGMVYPVEFVTLTPTPSSSSKKGASQAP